MGAADDVGVLKLRRVYRFKDFAGALAFTNRVGEIAEDEGHHPLVSTEWGQGHGVVVDAQDQGAARQRFHHGGEDGWVI